MAKTIGNAWSAGLPAPTFSRPLTNRRQALASTKSQRMAQRCYPFSSKVCFHATQLCFTWLASDGRACERQIDGDNYGTSRDTLARPRFTSLIIGTVLVFVNRSAFAQGQNLDFMSPQQVIEEMTYGQWSAAWWQRMLVILFGRQLPDPTLYPTGVYCNISQSGPEMLAFGRHRLAALVRRCVGARIRVRGADALSSHRW